MRNQRHTPYRHAAFAAPVIALVALSWSLELRAACHGGAPSGIRESGEQCDGTDNPYTCDQVCFVAGTMGGKSDCIIDESACQECGNGQIEPALGELCDGAAVTCPTGTHGTPSCASTCQRIDGCWRCGDGTRNVDEECDINDLGSGTCNGPGETGGTPGCTADCHIDHGPCWRCGNGRIDPGEQCDDANTTVGDGCGLTCQRECGNGTVEPNEECDDGNTTAGDGCHLCGLDPVYDGGGGQLRECAMHWGLSGPPAPGASVTCADGNPQCDVGTTANQCTFRVFYCFNRGDFVGGGPPPCTPTTIARVELIAGSLAGPGALTTSDRDAVLDSMRATLMRNGRLLRVPVRRRGWSTSLALAVLVTVGVGPAAGQPVPDAAQVELPAEWVAALQSYAGDPWAHRRDLRQLGRRGNATLPPIALLALGDARLRSGRRAAGRYFERVLEQKPGQPWEGFAAVGLGWIAVADEDLDTAQRRFATVAESDSPSRALAVLVIAFIDAERGDYASAIITLDALADMPGIPPGVRYAALVGGGYARYWAGRWDEAADHFERAVMGVAGSRLWDDARYGAALSRLKGGDRDSALPQLRALAQVASVAPPDERITPALLALQPGTLLRNGMLRYRRLPFTLPEDQLVGLLDQDGPELARVTLRTLGEPVATPPGSTRPRQHAGAARATGAVDMLAATPSRSEPTPVRSWPSAAIPALVGFASALGAYWWHRLRARTSPHGITPRTS